MKGTRETTDQKLLITSGVMAALVVATINLGDEPLWPGLLSFILFIAAFLACANREKLGLAARTGQSLVLIMLSVSVVELVRHPDTATLILSVVLMASIPYHFTPRQSWQLLLLANLSYFVILELNRDGPHYLLGWASLFALQSFAITSSLSRCREKAQQELLARQNNELIAARTVIAQQSQNEERLRIAGDLHDTIGHQLTALRLQLEALAHEAPEPLRISVRDCQRLSADLLENIRHIVRRMSDEQRRDLASAVARLAELTRGVSVSIEGDLPPLAPEISRQLVFCLQEAIHNAVRHGGADAVVLSYCQGALQVRDNGTGLRGGRATPGFGLANIDKRLAAFGGRSSLRNADTGKGCVLTLSFQTGSGDTRQANSQGTDRGATEAGPMDQLQANPGSQHAKEESRR